MMMVHNTPPRIYQLDRYMSSVPPRDRGHHIDRGHKRRRQRSTGSTMAIRGSRLPELSPRSSAMVPRTPAILNNHRPAQASFDCKALGCCHDDIIGDTHQRDAGKPRTYRSCEWGAGGQGQPRAGTKIWRAKFVGQNERDKRCKQQPCSG